VAKFAILNCSKSLSDVKSRTDPQCQGFTRVIKGYNETPMWLIESIIPTCAPNCSLDSNCRGRYFFLTIELSALSCSRCGCSFSSEQPTFTPITAFTASPITYQLNKLEKYRWNAQLNINQSNRSPKLTLTSLS